MGRLPPRKAKQERQLPLQKSTMYLQLLRTAVEGQEQRSNERRRSVNLEREEFIVNGRQFLRGSKNAAQNVTVQIQRSTAVQYL